MVHDEYTGSDNTGEEPQKRKRAPFYTDNMSTWKRKDVKQLILLCL